MKNLNIVNFSISLATLLLMLIIITTLTSIEDKLSTQSNVPASNLTTLKYNISPNTEDNINHYYSGFNTKYSDGKKHPHRQALKLLLSYLASQGGCPIEEITGSESVKENKKD